MRAVRRTSGLAFEDWLSAREPALQRTAHLLTGDVHTAQPLVQATLVRLYLDWGRVRGGDDIDVDVRRLLLEEYRRRPHGGADATTYDGDEQAVWRSVCSLPPQERAVVVLRFHEQLTDPEIADLMRTSVGAVAAQGWELGSADLPRVLTEVTEDAEYPTTPVATVVARAQAIRRGRRRTTALVAGAVVVVATVTTTAVSLHHESEPPVAQRVAPLPELAQGAAPKVPYLDEDAFVSTSGERITAPVLGRAATATPYDTGVLVASRATSTRPFSTISLVHGGGEPVRRLGCGAPSFALGADADPAYWLSDSCQADDTRRLVEGDTGRLVEGSTRAATTAVVALTPVGRVNDGVVAFGASENSTIGNATYVLEAQDGAISLVPHVEVPRGATPNGDLISGLAPDLTDSLVVDATTGSVRWRLPDWSLGRFSAAGRYVVGFRSAGLPHIGAVNDSVGIWEAATGHEVLIRDLPGLMLDSLPVWEDDDSVLVVAEDRSAHQAIIRVDVDGTVTRATRVGAGLPGGFRLAATP